MPFGHAQPQHEILLGDERHRLARQHHRSGRHRHLEHAARGRREHVAFGQLLFDHRAFGDAGAAGIRRDVESRARLVEPRAWNRAVVEQALRAVEVGLRLRELGVERGDLRIERFHLQDQLLVADRRQRLAAFDVIAIGDRKPRHRAADPRTRRNHIGAFDRREHGLLVADRGRLDGENVGGRGRRREGRPHGGGDHQHS